MDQNFNPAPSPSGRKPWESYLTVRSFTHSSVKGENNEVHNSDMHKSQAENIREGGGSCSPGEGHWCTKDNCGVPGASRLGASLSLPSLLVFNKSQKPTPKPFSWWARLTIPFGTGACEHHFGTLDPHNLVVGIKWDIPIPLTQSRCSMNLSISLCFPKIPSLWLVTSSSFLITIPPSILQVNMFWKSISLFTG